MILCLDVFPARDDSVLVSLSRCVSSERNRTKAEFDQSISHRFFFSVPEKRARVRICVTLGKRVLSSPLPTHGYDLSEHSLFPGKNMSSSTACVFSLFSAACACYSAGVCACSVLSLRGNVLRYS